MATSTKQSPRMSDAAVKAKTGKVWKDWFAVLDKAGARKMAHKDIAKMLSEEYKVGPWWCQSVTVAYEQDRGLREKHEKPEGYQIGVSRTVDVPLAKLYQAFASAKIRKGWLKEDGLAVRTANENKTMRVTWIDGKTSLEIYFTGKGAGKSQVVVQHSKLPDARTAAKMKIYWANALDKLREFLA